MLQQLELDNFTQHLGDSFRCTGAGEEPIDLKLSEAKGLTKPPSAERTPFSLIFVGPEAPLLEQQIHTLHHHKMGEFSLFLVPLGPGPGGLQYEAVFT